MADMMLFPTATRTQASNVTRVLYGNPMRARHIQAAHTIGVYQLRDHLEEVITDFMLTEGYPFEMSN